MGGGDLNLKKSWHPSTFANLEKVWKAESRHETEQKKIDQLQQELKEERAREEMQRTAVDAGVIKKKDSRVEWLYSGPTSSVNKEEYLLGKKIDRLVDPTLAEDQREKEALSSGPGALFVGGASGATDLAVKVREDPLFLIKQKEEEAKKKLSSNPIKLKQLQQLLERKGSSGHKKKKKHKRSRDQSPESPPRRKRNRSHSASPSRRHANKDRSSSVSPVSEERFHHRGHASSQSRKGDETSQKYRAVPSSSSRPQSFKRQPHSKPRSRTRGMDPEELEKRRQEMMTNAKEHTRDRERRLKHHQKEQQKDEEQLKTGKKADFLQSLRVQSLSSSTTLSDRIHRNINAVQRTSAKLDSHFLTK